MTDSTLRIGAFHYDTTQALFDGDVKIEGAAARFESAPIVSEIFERMMRDHAYDVSELGWTFYLRTLDLDEPPFLAIPVFPNRVFRHSAIFVNTSSGITTPQDLAGRTIGEFGMYGQDSGVWAKGLLSDEYGVTPDQCRWIIGGLDVPMTPFDFVPQPHPAGVDVRQAPEGRSLGMMLEKGEIDALISANAPACFLSGSPHVGRLFPDSESLGRDYYRRTGIYPMMHTVVMRRDILARDPGLARAVYQGFLEAKDAAAGKYEHARKFYQVPTMAPFFFELFEENRRMLGGDWWPYGVNANLRTVDAFLRFHYEQGLSKRLLTSEDIFVPQLLGS